MTEADENSALLERIANAEKKIYETCDFIPIQNWRFDDEIREKLRQHKQRLVHQQLSKKEKKMMSNARKGVVARTMGAPSTVSEVFEWLATTKSRPNVQLKTNKNSEKTQNKKEIVKKVQQPQKEPQQAAKAPELSSDDDSDEDKQTKISSLTAEKPKSVGKPIATVKPTPRAEAEKEKSDDEMEEDDDSTDEETEVKVKGKGGQKRKTPSDVKTPAKKTKLDKELEKFEKVEPHSLDPIESRHVALLKLQKKLESFKLNRFGKKQENQSAKAVEMVAEKKLKRRMSKLQLKQKRAEEKQKSKESSSAKAAKTDEVGQILNDEGKVVYSKFDFIVKNSKKRLSTSEKKEKFTGKDYRSLLHKAEKRNEKIAELKETDPEKAKQMEEDIKWNRALKKAEGVKVKDNIELLKKGLRKKEKSKEKRLNKWDQRVNKVKSDMDKRQGKRMENIAKRAEAKKKAKLTKMRKKGRII